MTLTLKGLGRLLAWGVGGCALAGAAGCSSRLVSYTPLYEQQSLAVRGSPPDVASAARLAHRFVDTFSAMGTDAFLPAADQLFVPGGLYVNDTLSVYHDYSQLRRHLADMNRSVRGAQVMLVDDWVSGDSVFVHWRMAYTLSLLGSQRDMVSYGISQLKTDATGRIIFQQDYWDSNNGLYRELPRVGWFYRWILPMKGL